MGRDKVFHCAALYAARKVWCALAHELHYLQQALSDLDVVLIACLVKGDEDFVGQASSVSSFRRKVCKESLVEVVLVRHLLFSSCRVAVSLSVANDQASLAVAYQLYLPHAWAADTARRAKAGA